MRKRIGFLTVITIGIAFLYGCGSAPLQAVVPTTEPVSTSTVTPSVAPMTSVTPTEVPTSTSTPTVTPTPTNTPTLTSTPTPTSTPIPTLTNTPTPTPDVEPPSIGLIGENMIEVIARSEYIEPGFWAEDGSDGDITGSVQVSGTVDVNWCGEYTLNYEVYDAAGNYASAQRIVIVKQPEVIVPDGKVIYLTFDDGPGKYTKELLELLEKYEVKATFFTCGNGRKDLVKEIHEAGHTIGIHCKSHDWHHEPH